MTTSKFLKCFQLSVPYALDVQPAVGMMSEAETRTYKTDGRPSANDRPSASICRATFLECSTRQIHISGNSPNSTCSEYDEYIGMKQSLSFLILSIF